MDCCGTWAKYVCNAAHLRSKCGCCELEAETSQVDVGSDSELECISQQLKAVHTNMFVSKAIFDFEGL